MQVDTSPFQNYHKRTPRGFGLWTFVLKGHGFSARFHFSGSYSRALDAARNEAANLSATTIEVQP